MLTRNGIAHDLNVSPYKELIIYDNRKITYTFSSKLNQVRFIERLNKNRNYYNKSLSKRFNFEIEFNILCDIKLYSLIEKRGILIELEEGKVECLNNIKFVGMNPILKN